MLCAPIVRSTNSGWTTGSSSLSQTSWTKESRPNCGTFRLRKHQHSGSVLQIDLCVSRQSSRKSFTLSPRNSTRSVYVFANALPTLNVLGRIDPSTSRKVLGLLVLSFVSDVYSWANFGFAHDGSFFSLMPSLGHSNA